MKQLLSIFIRFLLTVVAVLCITVILFFIISWSINYTPGKQFQLPPSASSLYSVAFTIFPAAFIVSLFFTFFLVKDITRSFLLTFILLTAASFALFTGGYSLLYNGIAETGAARENPDSAERILYDSHPLLEKRITPLEEVSLYAEEVSADSAHTVIIRKNDRMHYASEAAIKHERTGQELLYGEESIVLPEQNYWFSGMFTIPAILDRSIEEIELVNKQLLSYFRQDRHSFYLFSFSLLFFAVSAVFFSIQSGWQVFNIFLCFLLFRLLFLVNFFSNSELMKEIGTVFSGPWSERTHMFILLLVAAFFFIFHLLSLVRVKGRNGE